MRGAGTNDGDGARRLERALLFAHAMLNESLTREIEALEVQLEAAERENRKLRQDLRASQREALESARRVEALEGQRRADQKELRQAGLEMEQLRDELHRQSLRAFSLRQLGEQQDIEGKSLRDELGRLKEQLDRTRTRLLDSEKVRDRLMAATQEHHQDIDVWQQLAAAQSKLIKERDARILELESQGRRGHVACCGRCGACRGC